MPYLEAPETDDETRALTTEANDAMMDVRAYLREIASIDDDTLDEMTDTEAHALAREFAEASKPRHDKTSHYVTATEYFFPV